MSRKHALLASSLALATSTWTMSTADAQLFEHSTIQKSLLFSQQTSPVFGLSYDYLSPLNPVMDEKLAVKLELSPLVYTVKKDDNLYTIGKFFNVNYIDIIKFNEMKRPNLLIQGEEIKIPISRKWVKLGGESTLESIMNKYHTTKQVIDYLNSEKESEDPSNMIAVPHKLRIPPSKVTPSLQGNTKPSPKKPIKIPMPITPPNNSSYNFSWPVTGMITSNFGWRGGNLHKGLDIWNRGKRNCKIAAALDGVVITAGYSGAYGNLVVIDHGGGWITYYAHMSRIRVSKGQRVSSGYFLGYMGRTGDATGYHLHFEVHKNGRVVNPLAYLNR